MRHAFVLTVTLGLLASCAAPPPATEKVSDASASETAPESGKSAERFESHPLKHLAGRKLKPIPDKALEIRTRCSFKDVQGGRGSMDLLVTKAEVKRFVAEVTIPNQGLCRFDGNGFKQTARMPNVVLTDRDSACTVHMWEQERRITVSFNGCQSKCTGDAFSYLWPILIDSRNGRCA
jgi:hypothetical protein